MQKTVGIVLISIALLVLGAMHLPAIAKFRSYPMSLLKQEARIIQMRIEASAISGMDKVDQNKDGSRKEKFFYDAEIVRRKYYLEWLSVFLGMYGLGLIILNRFTKNRTFHHVSKVRLMEAIPTEEYVDEGEFYRRSQDAFLSKDEAVLWFENDPLRICSYCGSLNVKAVRGQKSDEIQLTTFYKKVPASAKDLRIVLGTLWFVKPAIELQCENCQQKVTR